MPSYIMRNIDPELWSLFKARAEADGHPLKWVILHLVRGYIERGLS